MESDFLRPSCLLDKWVLMTEITPKVVWCPSWRTGVFPVGVRARIKNSRWGDGASFADVWGVEPANGAWGSHLGRLG